MTDFDVDSIARMLVEKFGNSALVEVIGNVNRARQESDAGNVLRWESVGTTVRALLEQKRLAGME